MKNLIWALRTQLDYALTMKINRKFWNEVDSLCEEDLHMIYEVFDEFFGPVYEEFKMSVNVTSEIERAHTTLQQIVACAMDVPYPVQTDLHIQRVIANMSQVYEDFFEESLFDAMSIAGIKKTDELDAEFDKMILA